MRSYQRFSASDIFKFNPHPYRMRLEFEGLSHALPNSPPDCLVPSLCSGRAFESHLCTKNEPPQRGSSFFGASVLIGLFEKRAHTNVSSGSDTFRFHPHPFGMRLKSEGLSHELRKCPPDTFLPSLRSGRSFESHREHKNIGHPVRGSRYFGARDGTRTHNKKR